MESLIEFYKSIREAFPNITKKADKIHIKQWGDLDEEFAYSWFQSLANAINSEMNKNIPYEVHNNLFNCLNMAANHENDEICNCIDVSFTENLFWQVIGEGRKEYWRKIPPQIRELYIDFHHSEPCD